jgi:hypothetical protein
VIRFFAAITAVAFIVACGDSDDVPEPGNSPVVEYEPGEGSLIISSVNQIVERDLQSGDETVLLSSDEPSSFLLDAAPSADGTMIAYVHQPSPEVIDGRFDAGSDLWLMNRDGSSARPLFEHSDPNQLVRFPRWENEAHVLAIVTELSTVDGITRVLYTLQRFDVATGGRERVVENVLAFDVSPDGQSLVYSKFVQTGEILTASSISGSNEIEVVGVDQMLQPFSYPRFAPDGELVAFASADQTGAVAPGLRYVSRSALGGANASPRQVLFDGLPQDIWTVEATGGRAVRVADLKEDLPALTWDGSGERIYALGVSGLYDINVSSGAVERIGEGVFHGQIAWAPPVD